jgi:hypothetical protein
LLWSANLDYWPVVNGLLQEYPVAGAFKKVGHGFEGSASTWHWSGSFGWFRSAELFRRSWRHQDSAWWSIESYPGLHYRPEEAGCVFHEGRVPDLDMYRLDYVERAEREFAAWKEANRGRRTES